MGTCNELASSYRSAGADNSPPVDHIPEEAQYPLIAWFKFIQLIYKLVIMIES